MRFLGMLCDGFLGFELMEGCIVGVSMFCSFFLIFLFDF